MEKTKNSNDKFEIDAILSSDYYSSDKAKGIYNEEDDLLQSYKKQQSSWNNEISDNPNNQFDIDKGFNLNQSF